MRQPTAEEVSADEPPGVGPRHMEVLLIEASAPARYRLRLALKALGVEVRQASSAEQALLALRTWRPDLIVAAPVLPGMNALELLELLQTPGGTDAPPLVIRRRDAEWPLAAAAHRRGLVIASSDADLVRLLPTLLQSPTGIQRAEPRPGVLPASASAAEPERPARSHRDASRPRLSPPLGEATSGMHEPARRPDAPCWRLALATALAGLLLGAWIGWWSAW